MLKFLYFENFSQIPETDFDPGPKHLEWPGAVPLFSADHEKSRTDTANHSTQLNIIFAKRPIILIHTIMYGTHDETV